MGYFYQIFLPLGHDIKPFLFLDLYTKPSFFNSLCNLINSPYLGEAWDFLGFFVYSCNRWYLQTGCPCIQTQHKPRQCPFVEIIKFDFPPPVFVLIVFRIAFTYFWKLRKSNLLSPPNFSKRKHFLCPLLQRPIQGDQWSGKPLKVRENNINYKLESGNSVALLTCDFLKLLYCARDVI